jgi:hypothetical protein
MEADADLHVRQQRAAASHERGGGQLRGGGGGVQVERETQRHARMVRPRWQHAADRKVGVANGFDCNTRRVRGPARMGLRTSQRSHAFINGMRRCQRIEPLEQAVEQLHGLLGRHQAGDARKTWHFLRV